VLTDKEYSEHLKAEKEYYAKHSAICLADPSLYWFSYEEACYYAKNVLHWKKWFTGTLESSCAPYILKQYSNPKNLLFQSLHSYIAQTTGILPLKGMVVPKSELFLQKMASL